MNEEEKKYVDGCAIFWKKDKFVEQNFIHSPDKKFGVKPDMNI